MTTEAPKHATLIEALIAAQSEYPGIPREAEGQMRGGKYRYATLAAVLEAVVPALNRNGIALIQSTSVEGESLTLHTILRHTSGQEIASIIPLPTPQSWQEWGIALTYARRYTITALAGVAPEDDEDGAGAQGAPKVEAPHGICPDHGVPYFQTPKMRNPAHKRDDGGWCDKPETPGDDWDAQSAAARAVAQVGFGTERMPVATAQAPLGMCEAHRVPWYQPRTGGGPGHYYTPYPPRADGKRDWCHLSSEGTPSFGKQAAQPATVDAGEGYRDVGPGMTMKPKEAQGAPKV